MIRTLGLIIIISLSGCATKNNLVKTIDIPVVEHKQVNHDQLTFRAGQLKLIENKSNFSDKTNNTGELLNNILQNATQRPNHTRALNAITFYDFTPGSVYQIYTAPMKVTMLSFEAGEQICSAPQSGDTIRWQINKINSGVGSTMQQHLVIKPLRDGLRNNMIITSNKRVYLIELISFKNSYMANVSWNYQNDKQLTNLHIIDNSETNNSSKKFNNNYKIINKAGKPAWKPIEVYDDQEKTFIQFPKTIMQQELPVLYVVSRETDSQLVNYRYKNNCMIVDRLFQTADLKLGLNNPEVIRIKRIKT